MKDMYKLIKFGKNLYKEIQRLQEVHMNIESMQNIVVLKDIPSNMVEEAIVILKPNIKLPQNKEKKKENVKVGATVGKGSKEYILREAEEVVSQYISNLEKPKQLEMTNRKLIAKYNRIRTISVLCAVVGVLGIIVNWL